MPIDNNPHGLSRREFVRSCALGIAGAGLGGCLTDRRVGTPHPDFMWGNLVHLGMNSWSDVKVDHWGPSKDPVIVAMCEPEEHLRVDIEEWNATIEHMARVGVNTVVIDMAEGVRFDSHPELAVEGTWSQERFRRELDRMRALGMEPIPKMNFSTCHDTWLKEYGRMVTSRKYYEVCADLIREVAELFDHPRYLHLGYDEENFGNQSQYELVVIRQGELFWHDLKWFAETTERAGMRPWIWSDYYHRHAKDFLRYMPKSVIQSNWHYGEDFDPKTSAATRAYLALDKAGFDQIPTGSNWETDKNFDKTVDFALGKLTRSHLKGFLMASWAPSWNACHDKMQRAVDQIGAAKQRAEGRL